MSGLPTYIKRMILPPPKPLGLFFAILLSSFPVNIKANSVELSCSTTQNGKAVINEINTNNNFIEIYLLAEADISSWSIYLDEAPVQDLGTGSCTVNGIETLDNANGTTFPAGTFIVCYHSNNINPSFNEALLLDKTGLPSGSTVIDYLGYGKLSPKAIWTVPPLCGNLYPEHKANNEDIARIPDGTGSLADNNDESTPGASNDGSNGGGGDTAASNFNCVESAEDPISGRLYTKTTAQSLTVDIVALRDSSTLENNFASGADHTVNIELVDASTGSCSSYTALTPKISKDLIFSSADLGRKTVTLNNLSSAYKKVKCRVTDNTNPAAIITGCSTDSFAVRPTSFSVSSSTIASSATPTSSFTPTTKAGTIFELIFTGYSEQPNQIDNTKVEPLPNTSLSAELAGIRSSLAADSVFTGDFTYSDVGWLLLQENAIYDDIFTEFSGDEQAADCIKDSFENDPAKDPLNKNRVGCNFGNTALSDYFGRFTPDHFKVTDSSAGDFASACTGFTYNGQAFSYLTAPTLTVTAYNALSPASVTANYTGAYASGLNATDFNVTSPDTDATQLGADGSSLVNLSWTSDTPLLNDNADGSLSFSFGSDSFKYLHENNSKIAPFTPSVDFVFTDISDSDGIQTQSLPHTVQAAGSSIRFGRLNISNTHGSELSPLAVPLFTEYFNGSYFVTNIADTCSSIAVNQLSFNGSPSPVSIGSGSSTASISNSPLILGLAGLSLTAPGANNTGAVVISSDTFILSFPWLAYDWNGDLAHDNSPSARATFGIYKGNSKQIYFREVY